MKLAVILAFLFSGIDAHIPSTDPCDNLKVTTEIKHTTDGLDNGSVEVKVEGGVEPYVYVFFNEKGKPLSFENKSNQISEIGAGTIYCSIIDSESCQQKVEITIK